MKKLAPHFFNAFIFMASVLYMPHALAASNFTIEPFTTLPTYVLPGSTNILAFWVTNKTTSTRSNYSLSTLPSNVKQLYASQKYSDVILGNSFSLAAKSRGLLLLEVIGAASFNFSICNGTSCTSSAVSIGLQTADTTPTFPFGVAPSCNLSLEPFEWNPQYSTPETLLGSWAMQQAVVNDVNLTSPQQLPANTSLTLDSSNTVYAVGTAAVGSFFVDDFSGQCDHGCNKMGGQCFAIRFNEKITEDKPYPYMIFQSVNTIASIDTFDVYMAGGGCSPDSGNCDFCPTFWNTGSPQYECPGDTSSVNFACNIGLTSGSTPCDDFFLNYSSAKISTDYTVTDESTHTGIATLQDACAFAMPTNMTSTGSSGTVSGTADFNMGIAGDGTTAGFYKISAVPVTCPQYLTQVTGLAVATPPIAASITLSELTKTDFDNATLTITHDPSGSGLDCYNTSTDGCPATTQMQDCKTPSTGFDANNQTTQANYAASYSAAISVYNATTSPPATAPYTTIPGTSTIGNDCG